MAKKPGVGIMIAVGKPKPGPDETEGYEEEAPEEGADFEAEGAELPPEEAEGAYPEFSIPEGLDLSDIEPGEEKEVLCVIGKTSDGTACIKQVDGVDLAGMSEGMSGPPPMPPPGPPPGMGMPGPGAAMGPVQSRAAAAGLM